MSSDFVNSCYSSYKETFIAGSGFLVTFHWQVVALIFTILSGNAMDIFWFVFMVFVLFASVEAAAGKVSCSMAILALELLCRTVESRLMFTIPTFRACITTVVWGTTLWLEVPQLAFLEWRTSVCLVLFALVFVCTFGCRYFVVLMS